MNDKFTKADFTTEPQNLPQGRDVERMFAARPTAVEIAVDHVRGNSVQVIQLGGDEFSEGLKNIHDKEAIFSFLQRLDSDSKKYVILQVNADGHFYGRRLRQSSEWNPAKEANSPAIL